MATVTLLGSANASTSSATLALTITANVAVGETIFVGAAFALNSGSETLSFTDSGSNSYTRDQAVDASVVALNGCGQGRAICTTALTSGVSTITVTVSGAVNERLICAFKVSAGDVRNPVATDGSANNESVTAGTTTAFSSAVTPTFVPDFGVWVVSEDSAPSTGTPSAGWTEAFDFTATTVCMQMNYLTAPTTNLTALNPGETISASRNWVTTMVLYKGPLGGAQQKDQRNAIPFTGGAGGGSLGGGSPH